MSRYGHEEILAKTTETPYPPILEFVPQPPYPSAASSVKADKKTTEKSREGDKGCVKNAGEPWNADSTDDYSTDMEERESLPEYPADENDDCIRANCPHRKGSRNKDEEVEGECEDVNSKWYTTSKKRIRTIDIQTRLSDISIREEEYQAALSAGKIHLRGKGQQLYEPLLGEVSPESDRIKFHFFLKKTGVLSIIARSMLALYDEPNRPEPEDALEYMINSVGFKLVVRDTIQEMRNYKESLLIRYQRLSVENDWLHRAMDVYEPTELDLNGRPLNPYNTLEFPQDEFDFQYDEETYEKLREEFSEKRTPTQEELKLSYEFENDLLSFEEFEEAMTNIDPNYLNLTDISSDEDDPKPTVKQLHISDTSPETETTPVVGVQEIPSNTPEELSISARPKEESKKTVAVIAAIAATTARMIKPSELGVKPYSKRKMSVAKSDDMHKTAAKTTARKLKKKAKDNNSLTHVPTGAAAKKSLVKDSEVMLSQHSFVKLFDPEEDKQLKQIIMEEEDDIKKPLKWFTYDYEEEDFEDLCGMRRGSTSDLQSIKAAEEDLDGSDGEEQVPILNDTSDDDTGMENITPEMHGHIDTQTMVGSLHFDSDEDNEFIKDYDYQEPELSSDEEDFGRKRKLPTALKYRIRKTDSSAEEEESDWPSFDVGEDQLIDVMEMEPVVPYSSDEDELDIDLVDPPCYELPLTRTILPYHHH